MYVIARHTGEGLEILDGLIKVKVLSINGNIVRLGFDAPREIPINRDEQPTRDTPNEPEA